ncbi:MAG: tetratricopeptide repeat protein, partial [Akkermansiaceae bacterium]|nr:tetratricopeptide repeat protein [Verrucomicrobiales bacterium]
KPAEALKVLDEAARVSNPGFEFLISLGELYSSYGMQNPTQREAAYTSGAAVFERAIPNKPLDPQLRLRLADGLNMFGKPEAAAKIYQEVLKQLPDLPLLKEGVRTKLTDIYVRGKDHQHAVEQLEDIVRDDPTDAQAYYRLGSIAYSQTNYARAAEHFSKVLLLSPDAEQPYYDLAAAQLNAEQSADALITLEKARAKFPQKFYPEYLTGMAYNQQQNFTNALKHFTAAEIIALANNQKQNLNESFYFQLGATSERVGDFAQAEKFFEKCLELSPNNDEAQNYLGFMLADRGEKLEHARNLIEKALKARPDSAAYLDSMGWVLFRLNQPKEALVFLLDAVKNSEEEDATIYDHLGDVHAALNQLDQAREAWMKSLQVEPSDAVRKKLDSASGGEKARP